MGRSIRYAVVALALAMGPVPGGGCVSMEIGFVAGYPVGTTFYMEEAGLSFVSPPIFWGAYIVLPLSFGSPRSSPFLIDTGLLFWPEAEMSVLRVDLGLGWDMWIFRTSIAAGVSFVSISDPYYGDYLSWGSDLSVRLGAKLGHLIIGVGLAAPLGAVFRFVTQDWPIVRTWQDEEMLFAGQLTASIGYSF
jgi:hypothetical protein